jgi:hypothetical protein
MIAVAIAGRAFGQSTHATPATASTAPDATATPIAASRTTPFFADRRPLRAML